MVGDAGDTEYFQNSQHLNENGAEIFSGGSCEPIEEYFCAISGGRRLAGFEDESLVQPDCRTVGLAVDSPWHVAGPTR